MALRLACYHHFIDEGPPLFDMSDVTTLRMRSVVSTVL
jgi:hypothetical protein